MIQDLVVTLVFIGYAIGVLMTFGTMLTWVERKQAAVMSDRIGANRAYVRIPFTQVKLVWLGLFHGMADGLKMLLKEDFKPDSLRRASPTRSRPWVVFTPVLLVFAVIPFGGTLDPGRLFAGRWPAGSASAPTRCRSRSSTPACWSSSPSAASPSSARCSPAGRRTTSSRCSARCAPARR